jgi:N-acetylmuramoyl-L-alanine amidase
MNVMKTTLAKDLPRAAVRLLSPLWACGSAWSGGMQGTGDISGSAPVPKVAVASGAPGRLARWAAGRWSLGLAFVAAFSTQAMPQRSANDANKVTTVVLDAGHGGKDPGNLGTRRYKTTEKDVALAVTLLVGKYITENLPDVNVVYTRKDDRFIELMERDNIANRAKADVFISIHCNSNNSADPRGCETYVMGLHKTEANMRVAMKENQSILLEDDHELKYDGYDPNDPESMIALSLRQNAYLDHSLLLSSMVQDQFKDRVGRVDRGVKQAGFLVISYTTMPAVLIELGFLTNSEEEDYLQGTQGQEYMASAIYRAFKEYKARIENKDVAFGAEEARADSTAVDTADAGTLASKGGEVRFKVQIITSSKKIPEGSSKFKGLDVEETKAEGLWKYSVGSEPDLDGARKVQQRCKDKGFDGCFITAYQDGHRIDLRQAVNLTRVP